MNLLTKPLLFFFCSQVLGLKLPNLLGRAEKVTFQFSYGTKETSYGLSPGGISLVTLTGPDNHVAQVGPNTLIMGRAHSP